MKQKKRKASVTLLRTMELAQGESDRGCILILGEWLNELLASTLAAFFADDERIAGDLLGAMKPVGTFSARIKMAYCVGLIPKDVYEDLEIVREIRNDAAHFEQKRGDGFDFSLTAPATVARIARMASGGGLKPLDPREDLIANIGGLSGYLFSVRERAKHQCCGDSSPFSQQTK